MFILLPGTNRLGKEGNMLLLLLLAIGLFIACTVASCNEVRYAIGGSTQAAAFEKAIKFTRRSDTDGSNARLEVYYTITEADGTKRHETDKVDMDWFESHRATLVNEDSNSVNVQFLAGSPDRSRLVGNTSRWVLIPFVLVIVFLAFISIRFMQDFNAHQRRMARGRDD